MPETKMVIVMRKDLGMRKGKMIAQGGHAVCDAVFRLVRSKLFQEWLNQGQKKIVVGVNSEKELVDIALAAEGQGLKVARVKDAGHTELEPGTFTCIAIGPDYEDNIDPITKELTLL